MVRCQPENVETLLFWKMNKDSSHKVNRQKLSVKMFNNLFAFTHNSTIRYRLDKKN